MAVYFKFSSWGAKANFDTVVLDSASPYLSVGELKQAIIKKKKIEKNNTLVVTNAQTGEGWYFFWKNKQKFIEGILS
jgi:hypothetical protein